MQSKQWPAWSEHFIKSGFPASSLLAGTEPAVWDALGRLELKDFDNSKQVLVRKALDDIGLGWVATNTTPFRIEIGGLFDAARKYHQEREIKTQAVASRNPYRRSSSPPANSRKQKIRSQGQSQNAAQQKLIDRHCGNNWRPTGPMSSGMRSRNLS